MNLSNLILSNNAPTNIRILTLSGIAWLPLVVFTLIDGTLITTDITVPFLKDVVPYVRGLIVIPLLVMADDVVEPMMARTLNYLQTSSVVPGFEQERLSGAAEKMAHLINSKWIQLILIILAVAISWMLSRDYLLMWTERGVTSWVLHLENGEADPSLAGRWFMFISTPMMSFLLYRWLWRFVAWSIFLYRVSRLKLELYASHSDLAGGLGMIGVGQSLFGIVFLVMAALLSSELANNILYEGDKLVDVKMAVIVFITGSVIVLTVPLFFFAKRLFNLKQEALAEYATLQNQASRDFHQHWINGKANDLVDSMQPSAMADYTAVFQVIGSMRILPMSPKAIAILAAILALPFSPLALTESSIIEVIQMIGGALL